MPTLTLAQLTSVSESLLKAAGASKEEARTVTYFLVKANLAGVDSHGVFPNLITYIQALREGTIKPRAKIEIRMESHSIALVNGNWGFGQVVCSKAMEIAIDKARRTGVGVVGIFNCNHIGRLADYAEMGLDSGIIGFIAVNTDPSVAPYGGTGRVLGTNPFCYAIPAAQDKPVVVDFATSVMAEGKVRAALYQGKQLPPGSIVDSQGRPSTNPSDLYEPPLPPERIKLAGALLPAGGHKGYGMGLVIELLAGALSGTGCGEEMAGLTNGVIIITLRINQFVPLREFKARVDRLIRVIKNSPKAQGFEEILIPGEPESNELKKRSRNGIAIPETAWQPLVEACEQYGVDVETLIHT